MSDSSEGDDDAYDGDLFGDEEADDCGWMPGTGWCGHMGSEGCEFDCPHRGDLREEQRKIQAGEMVPEEPPNPCGEP